MKVTKRDAALLIGLLGLIIAGLTYYFIYNKYTPMAKQMEADNQTLAQRVTVLQELANKRDTLLSETEDYNGKTDKLLDRFPSDIREDDVIMFAVELQNNSPFEYINSVGISDPVDVYTMQDVNALAEEAAAALLGTTAAPTDQPAPADPNADPNAAADAVPQDYGYVLRNRNITINANSTYEGFKSAVKMITGRKDRTTLNVTASYDMTTGLVASNFALISDYISGTGKEYIPPVVPFVQKGTDNIFGTVELTPGGGGEAGGEAEE